ncbi:hypothetical protein GALL_299860 [mine drainage metagenome]|uniref:Transposase InsH N-terminal domain-containing protein n=1 Tax=mine drainage metagenome TaxID=410659 RepID=A0A1J5QWR0_9ZZZZ
MKQADLGLDLTSRKTRKGKFLDEMDRVVPWAQLLALIERHAPRKERGRPPFGAEVMLRIHFLHVAVVRPVGHGDGRSVV